LHAGLPTDPETAGLLALMLLTHARSAARVDDAGDLVPLGEQDRTRWDREAIDRGTRLVERALPHGPVGPFQLQAAIAAVHDEAATAAATDWGQIVELYRMLDRIAPSSVVTLNLAIAIGMADGPTAGLDALSPLIVEPDRQRNHRVWSAHAHLLSMRGDPGAAASFRRAASLTTSLPEQRYLHRRAVCEEATPDV
jgi:predicted RNA polymerase sigma factor